MRRGILADSSMLRGEPPLEYLAKANQLERQGKEMVRFEIGQPDFDTPEHVKEAAIKALNEGFTHYVPSDGIPELKEAIQEDIEESRGFKPTLDQILVLPGAKPGLYFSLISTIQKGDEVIYQNPCFFTFDSMVGYMGAKKVQVPLYEENEFRMTPDEIQERITDDTRMIIINSPQNPTGAVLTKNDIKEIAEMAKDEDIYILSDEIYSKMYYDGLEHNSPSYWDECNERTIIIDGFSKAYSMTGWRVGYSAAPKDLMKPIRKAHDYTTVCSPTPFQKAAVSAIDLPEEYYKDMVEYYRKGRDLVYKELKKSKMKPSLPNGAYYMMADISEYDMNDKEFADYLVEKKQVAVVPGTSFYKEGGEDLVRFCFSQQFEDLKEAMKRIIE